MRSWAAPTVVWAHPQSCTLDFGLIVLFGATVVCVLDTAWSDLSPHQVQEQEND